ncbi:hypothetical protein F7Q99_37035 [Streptomyces kaniharaensis]|uniref:Uncharacterized protein n=1 Tax=Streptomyces kaniharaensis TaxID=212423 RepID=A0A6N7L4R5_9ACTN|nr:hypothetical protein [Streptomyces kaniharaensis]MQS17648.1 hypothetical protein [Streptomyces kaniharaensis]
MKTKTPLKRCARCPRRAPKDWTKAVDWSGKWEKGQLKFLVCPDCQTAGEHAESEVNAAHLMVQREDAHQGGGEFLPDPVVCMTGTTARPGEILYGGTHLRQALLTGQSQQLWVVEGLPLGTRCVASVGGVMVYRPRPLGSR